MEVKVPNLSKYVARVWYPARSYQELCRECPILPMDDYKRQKPRPIEICSDVKRTREPVQIRFDLVNFEMVLTTKQVLAELDGKGFRPAMFEELLGFIQAYEKLVREKSFVVALGSVLDNFYDEPCSPYTGCQGPRLDLGLLGSPWGPLCHFLAVRK